MTLGDARVGDQQVELARLGDRLLDRAAIRDVDCHPLPADLMCDRLDLRSASWFPIYLGGMAIISWLGQFDGRSKIPFWWDLAIVCAFSAGIFLFALAVRLSPEETQHYIGDLTEEDREEAEELHEVAPAR